MKGYPDFFGFSIFPQFGAYQYTDSGAIIVAANTWGTIFDISAKGRIYTGYIAIQDLGLADTSTIFVEMTVDGQLMYSFTLDVMQQIGHNQPFDLPFVLAAYDKKTNYYNVVLQSDFSFSQSVLVRVFTDATAQIFVHGYLIWAKVIG